MLVEGFFAGQIPGHQPVAHRIAQGHVEVMARGAGGQLAQGEKQVLSNAGKQVIGAKATALRVLKAAGGGHRKFRRLLAHRMGCHNGFARTVAMASWLNR